MNHTCRDKDYTGQCSHTPKENAWEEEFDKAVYQTGGFVRVKPEVLKSFITRVVAEAVAKRDTELVEEIEQALVKFPQLDKYLDVVKNGNKDDAYECGYNMAKADILSLLTNTKEL